MTVHWDVTDPESPDTLTTTGCEPLTITADQPKTTYTCTRLERRRADRARASTVERDGNTAGRDDVTTDPDAPDGTNGLVRQHTDGHLRV